MPAILNKLIDARMLKMYFLSNTKNARGKSMRTFYIVDPKEELYLCTSLSSRTLGLRSVLDQNKGHYINSQCLTKIKVIILILRTLFSRKIIIIPFRF